MDHILSFPLPRGRDFFASWSSNKVTGKFFEYARDDGDAYSTFLLWVGRFHLIYDWPKRNCSNM